MPGRKEACGLDSAVSVPALLAEGPGGREGDASLESGESGKLCREVVGFDLSRLDFPGLWAGCDAPFRLSSQVAGGIEREGENGIGCDMDVVVSVDVVKVAMVVSCIGNMSVFSKERDERLTLRRREITGLAHGR